MYAKLFASLYQGTLRGDSHGILVFTNLLAHCDSKGFSDIHPRAIAEEVGLKVEEVKAALLTLEKPDPESRSAEEEGRRIVRMDDHRDWGWRVVNFPKYRAIRSEDDRREQNRLAQERFRQKHAESKQSKPCKPRSAQAEAEAEEINSTALSGKPDVIHLKADAREILTFLNEKTGRAYKPVDANLNLIVARFKEGYSAAEMRQVIAKKSREWAGDENMATYLRPETLFGKLKMAQYTGELVIPKEPSHA